MVSNKTSRDVGMVPPSCMEKKQQEQGGVYNDILTTQVNICQLQGTLDTYFTINLYIWQQLICLVRLLFQTICYSDLHLTAQFTIMHHVMQGECIQMPCKSSLCHAFIVQ